VHQANRQKIAAQIIIIIIIINITTTTTTTTTTIPIEFPLSGNSPYTSKDKTNKNKDT